MLVGNMPTALSVIPNRGGVTVTDTELLRKKIQDSGLKLRFVAEKIGITYYGLLKKMNNETEFKASEIQVLHALLRLSEEERNAIFFGRHVDN